MIKLKNLPIKVVIFIVYNVIMSKYNKLWIYAKNNKKDDFKLTFLEIENILGFPIDHSFLTYKKELLAYGFSIKKISMKEKVVEFHKE